MPNERGSSETPSADVSRRDFVRTTAVVAGGATLTGLVNPAAWAAGSDRLGVGLIGCGGRGTGAAFDSLNASDATHIVAMADMFEDRLAGSRAQLAGRGARGTITDGDCFFGFDAYQRVIARDDVDLVILATPPHFRPIHLEAAVAAGKHVFMEKPAAVDPAGVRKVIAAAEVARKKGLSIVAGTQRRHEHTYLQAMKRLRDGAIGDVVGASCYWNQGGLWVKNPNEKWTDMEWQLRNWLYFTWLSGDHITEQHVHNIDVCNWAIGGPPLKAHGMGGRQVRTGSEYGHIFDHFAVEFEYPNGGHVLSMCRQTDGCASRVEERLHGTKGRMLLSPNRAIIKGAKAWRAETNPRSPYVQEHMDLVASIQSGKGLNEAKRVAESTLTAIMGRMSAYTGQNVSWEQAMNSELDLSPDAYALGPIAIPPVPVPGRTPLV
jgi:predicted dehydrogenase